jgi:hypothetical protein
MPQVGLLLPKRMRRRKKMLEKSLVNRQIDEKFEERTADTLIREDVLQLVEQLQNAGML